MDFKGCGMDPHLEKALCRMSGSLLRGLEGANIQISIIMN